MNPPHTRHLSRCTRLCLSGVASVAVLSSTSLTRATIIHNVCTLGINFTCRFAWVFAFGIALWFGQARPVLADVFGTGINTFTIDFVTIPGDTGNLGSWGAGEDYTFSGVNRDCYRIGVYEITNAQWDRFVASLGVPLTGSPSNAYGQGAAWSGDQRPTSRVSWYEAAQFVNWLNTSTGHQPAYRFTGTQGLSDYTLALWDNVDAETGSDRWRHKDAAYYLPSEDEWMKAAYWNGTTLQTYATPGAAVPVEDVEARYGWPSNQQPWDVGSGAVELNGTYDMMGNFAEWTETQWIQVFEDLYDGGDPYIRETRAIRGGQYNNNDETYIASTYRDGDNEYSQLNTLGFRVAADVPTIVPTPGSGLVLAAALGLSLLRRGKNGIR